MDPTMSRQELTPIRWFEEQGITDYDLVMSNPRKGRQCYMFVDSDGNKCFLKWNDSLESNSVHCVLMQKEEKVYKLLQNTNIAPRYLGGGMFVTDYVDGGETLRKRLKKLLRQRQDEQALCLLRETFKKWKLFCEVVNMNGMIADQQDATVLFDSYLMSLLVSGPIETKKNIFIHYRNRLLLSLFRLYLKNNLYKKLASIIPVSVHGDFHLNNIIVDSRDDVFLLDFENVKTGLTDIEMAYIIAQIDNISEANDNFREKLVVIINELDLVKDCDIYRKILKVYRKAIHFNKRFR